MAKRRQFGVGRFNDNTTQLTSDPNFLSSIINKGVLFTVQPSVTDDEYTTKQYWLFDVGATTYNWALVTWDSFDNSYVVDDSDFGVLNSLILTQMKTIPPGSPNQNVTPSEMTELVALFGISWE